MTRFALSIPAILALVACADDDRKSSSDIVSDIVEPSDLQGDATPDSSEPADLPMDIPADVPPGQSVTGTTLEGVTITWTEPLTLCNAWVEGAPLADEKARKVIATIPAQTRTTLDEGVLAAARLDDLTVRTSPFAAGFHRPTVLSTRVTEWRLRETEQGDSLFVSVIHELDGDAGTIHEEYNVFRAPGSPTPVVVSPESYEMTFAWTPPGRSDATVRLERCGGDPALEDAISVIHAVDEAGGDGWVTILRFWRTTAAEVAAGSHAVHLTGHHIITSDAPAWPLEVRDFWAQTYVAHHHNFNETTEIDLTRDVGHWHHTFRNRTPGTAPVAKVHFDGVFGFDSAAIVITRETDAGPVTRRFTVPDGRSFPRIDGAALARRYATACDGAPPEVTAAGYGDHRAQLLVCAGISPEIVGLVPFIWASDPGVIGQRFDVAGTDEEYTVFRIGERDVRVAFQPDEHIEMVVASDDGEVVAHAYDPATVFVWPPPWTARVRAEGAVAAKELSLTIERLRVAQGIGKSQIYAPLSLTLTYGDDFWHVDAWDRLSYTNTHHNWEDSLVAEAADGTVIRWSTSFFGQRPNELTITGPGGEVILPATVFPKLD